MSGSRSILLPSSDSGISRHSIRLRHRGLSLLRTSCVLRRLSYRYSPIACSRVVRRRLAPLQSLRFLVRWRAVLLENHRAPTQLAVVHRSRRPRLRLAAADRRVWVWLIRDMPTANPLWDAPRIHGELLKLGIAVSQSTVAKYMRRHPRPPSKRGERF